MYHKTVITVLEKCFGLQSSSPYYKGLHSLLNAVHGVVVCCVFQFHFQREPLTMVLKKITGIKIE